MITLLGNLAGLGAAGVCGGCLGKMYRDGLALEATAYLLAIAGAIGILSVLTR